MTQAKGSVSGKTDTYREQQFLRFLLLPDTHLMISLKEIAAVLKIPLGQIVPIPELPPWVMGIYNWRGQIIWMVDLGQLLGFTPWHQQASVTSFHKAIVIHPSEQNPRIQATGDLLGLVVSEVNDIELCNPAQIHSPPSSVVTPELAPFLRGYWLKDNGDIIITLDADAIFSAMPKE